MLTSETLIGPQLLVRLPELKAMGAFVTRLDVGRTNSEWILTYHIEELELFQSSPNFSTTISTTPKMKAMT